MNVISFILSLPAILAVTTPLLADPGVNDTLYSARLALDRGDKEQALKLAHEAVRKSPKTPACYLLRAAVYDSTKQFGQAVTDYGVAIKLSPEAVGTYQHRGEDEFRLGHFTESVADFDQVCRLDPDQEPYHWQRGISLYYAGEFERGAKQFALHKAVNPDDVENAVWHCLCVARTSGVDKAKAGLIHIEGDGRVPMMQIYAMFEGKASPQSVLDAARAGAPDESELKRRLFYAHLYIGLFHEAAGERYPARENILLAADKYAADDYMGDVARVHAARLRSGPATIPSN